MNICFVLISTEWGGGENVVHQMISHMVERNIKVSLILNHEIRKYFEDLDVKMLDLGSLFDTKCVIQMINSPENSQITSISKPLKFLHLPLMFLYFHRVRARIKDFCKLNTIDILHSHIEYSDILCYIVQKDDNNKVKWISNIHGPWFSLFYSQSKLSSISNFVIIKFLKKAFKEMEKIIFVSKYLYMESGKIFGELVMDKGQVIHNGITLSPDDLTVSGVTENSAFNLNRGFNILFPGGPKLKKGGDILIESIKDIVNEIPELNLYIALDVPPDHLIRKLVKEYNLEHYVNFVGFLKPNKYMELLSTVDILAMPSRMEPFGMVYLEAMSLGIPIVASDVGGGAEIIENYRNGIITPPEPEYVAKSILTLYHDEALRKKISINNLDDINKFDWAKLIDEYIKIYKELIK